MLNNLVIGFLGFAVFWKYLMPWMTRRYRFLPLDSVPALEKNPKQPLKTSIVIGGSLTGIVTAKVLSKHSEQVIVLEKAIWEAGKSIAPHTVHAHTLMWRGMQTLSKEFPGLPEALKKHPESVEIDWATDMTWHTAGGFRVPTKSSDFDLKTISLQRIPLENVLRDEIKRVSNVKIMEQTTIKDLIFDPQDKLKVIGVRVVRDGVEEEILGDFIADCGGSNSPTHQSIPKHTGKSLEVSAVKCDLNYMAVIREYNSPQKMNTFVIYQPQAPKQLTGVLVMPWDQNKFVFLMSAMNGVTLPRDLEEVEAFMKQFPKAYDLYKEGVIYKKPFPYTKEATDYRHFERVFLKNFVALGDSVCSFNPAYAQGQTTASEAAFLLDYHLWNNVHKDNWCHEYQLDLCYKLSVPYLLVAAGDLQFKGTTGGGILRHFAPVLGMQTSSMLKAGSRDKFIHETFMKSLHMHDGFWENMFTLKFYYSMIRGNLLLAFR